MPGLTVEIDTERTLALGKAFTLSAVWAADYECRGSDLMRLAQA